MSFIPFPQGRVLPIALIVFSVLALLFGPFAAMAADIPNNKGRLETTAGLYEFTPISCALHEEENVLDIEIQGPGTAPDGEMFYFDFSSTANELTIELGVDAPFETTDRTLKAGQFVSQAFAIERAGDVISVPALVLVDEQGEQLDPNAKLRINCAA